MDTPIRAIIVEDESLAAERLVQLIQHQAPHIEIAACLDSIEEAVAWLSSQAAPDLAFFDIQLADGLSFEIFERCEVSFPVIFTTAYDHYAVKAFKVNSIDYLLKPLGAEDLAAALARFSQRRSERSDGQVQVAMRKMLEQVMQQPSQKGYKTRYVVKSGSSLVIIPVEEILYFYHESKIVWLKRRDLKKYAVDFTLEELEGQLDPKRFFRLNRRYLAAFESIKQIVNYSNQRLRLSLPDPPDEEPIVVSRERASDFRRWLEGE